MNKNTKPANIRETPPTAPRPTIEFYEWHQGDFCNLKQLDLRHADLNFPIPAGKRKKAKKK